MTHSLVGKRVYCLDLDGLTESRGPTKGGGKVYASVDELPADRDDLAVIWVHRKRPRKAGWRE